MTHALEPSRGSPGGGARGHRVTHAFEEIINLRPGRSQDGGDSVPFVAAVLFRAIIPKSINISQKPGLR